MNGTFEEHKLSDCDWTPLVFYPKGKTDKRAHILVPSDGTSPAFILRPKGDDPNFEYEKNFIANVKDTMKIQYP